LTSSLLETKNSGYSGEGYVNFNASSDAAIQWNSIYCAITGTKNVKFRYALEKGTRKLDVYANGTKVVGDVAFEATGSWTTWSKKTIQVPMNSGTNTLKVVTTGTEGPNIDSINVTAQ
jgi:glucuronoarabinoxylan endo-1,4-beta-xylanase